MNNRQRMRASNKKARLYLLNVLGASDVYFQPHTKRKYTFFNKEFSYTATDFFNLFDGLCFIDGVVVFFQVKTNSWPSSKPIYHFISNKHGCRFLAINVRTRPAKVSVRWYN